MSFGFSIGDFITVGRLISDIVLSLRDSRSEYQHLIDQLLTLQEVLNQVACIDPPEELRITANIIKATSLRCETILTNFRDKVKKYDRSLGSNNSAGTVRNVERKLRWGASNKAADVQKLQQELASYVGSINIALGIYNIRVSALEVKQAQEQRDRIEDGVRHTNQELQAVQDSVKVFNRSVVTNLLPQLQGISDMTGRILYVLTPDCFNCSGISAKLGGSAVIFGMEKLLTAWSAATPPPDIRHTWLQEPVMLNDAIGWAFVLHHSDHVCANEF